MQKFESSHNNLSFLQDGGEMGARIEAFDWSHTELGPIESWHPNFQTAVALMLGSQHPIWIGGTAKAIFLYNDAYAPLLGPAKHPWALGRPAVEVWPEIWSACGLAADKVFETGRAACVEGKGVFLKYETSSEENFWSFSCSPIRDESGSVLGLFCPSTLATEEKLIARRLDASYREQSALLSPNSQPPPNAPKILLAAANADIREYLRRLLSPFYKVTSVEDGQAVMEKIQGQLADILLADVSMPRLDGVELLKQLRSNPRTRTLPVILLAARAGEQAREEGLGAGADDYLTKPFSARELLARIRSHLDMARLRRQGEDRVTRILASITDGFHYIDSEGRLTEFNAATRAVFAAHGVDADTLIGQRFLEVVPGAQANEMGRALARALKERVPTSAEHLCDVWQRWFYIRHFPTPDGGVATFFHDFTERKHAEERLRRNRDTFSNLIENAPFGVYVVDHQLRLAQVSAGAQTAFRNVRPLLGRDFAEIMHILWPEPFASEAVGRFRHTLETGEPYTAPLLTEHRRDTADIESYSWKIQRITMPDDQFGVVCYFFDITEHKQAQQILERTVAERTGKLRETVSDLEAFSYSIAHDMRAPLRSLQGFGQLLAWEYSNKLDPTGVEYIRRITTSAERMDQLIQDVLNYSKIVREDLPIEPVDVGSLLRGIIESYPKLSTGEASIDVEEPLPKALGNHANVAQCLSNLLHNAVKFVGPGVRPQIRVWAEKRGASVRLFVKDNGIGIPADQHKKIFGLFERVSPDYEGTGIGLAIVKKSVERMGGAVGVESAPGKGSTFWIELREAS